MMAERFPWLVAACAVLGLLLGWANGGLPDRGGGFGGGFAPNVPVAREDFQPAGALAAYDTMWRGVRAEAPRREQEAAQALQWRLAGVFGGRALFVSPDGGGAQYVAEGETAPDGRRVERIGPASVVFEGEDRETRLYDGQGGEGR